MIIDSEYAKAAYYSALLPIVGTRLQSRRVAVIGLAAVASAAERLADCRVLRWQLCDEAGVGPQHPLARLWGRGPVMATAAQVFAQHLRARTPWETGWELQAGPSLTERSYSTIRQLLAANRPDLILGGGDEGALRLLGRLARDLDVPAVLVALGATNSPRSVVLTLLPGDGGQGREVEDLLRFLAGQPLLNPAIDNLAPEHWFNWQEANAEAAAIARALLLQGSSYAPPDLTRLLLGEHRTALVQGTPGWPWATQYVDLASVSGYPPRDFALPTGPTRSLARGPILIVGCGSLGSHAARALVAAGAVRELALIDSAAVDPADLACQFYSGAQVGRNRAEALAQQLAQLVPATGHGPGWMISAVDEHGAGLRRARGDWCFTQLPWQARPGPSFDNLLARLQPAVVILAIDNAGDEDLARVLRERGVPHIVARCDAHARYFEVVAVDGPRGLCLGCMRETIFPAPARTAATIVETGRAADAIARLAWQLSLGPRDRAPWFTYLLAQDRTALIGSTGQVGLWPILGHTEPPAPSDGTMLPGAVVARGPAPARFPCPDCGYLAPLRAAG